MSEIRRTGRLLALNSFLALPADAIEVASLHSQWP